MPCSTFPLHCVGSNFNIPSTCSIDLSLPVTGSIDRLTPAWSTNLLDTYLSTIDAFSKYDNVLAYNVGNEVVINPNGTAAAAFIKAAARDIKSYLYVATLCLAFQTLTLPWLARCLHSNSKSSSALVGYAAIDANDSVDEMDLDKNAPTTANQQTKPQSQNAKLIEALV